MARYNLLEAPPYAVEQALKKVGRNLRLARLRRKQTIEEFAKRIGTGSRAVRNAESGKAPTDVALPRQQSSRHGHLTPQTLFSSSTGSSLVALCC